MNRECKACDGTGMLRGVIETVRRIGLRCGSCAQRMGAGNAYLQFGGHHYCSVVCLPHPCVPCLGSGRISERIPASDAVADAETLRLSGGAKWIGACAGASYAAYAHAWASDYSGFTRWTVLQDARAAFRAVPGLRG